MSINPTPDTNGPGQATWTGGNRAAGGAPTDDWRQEYLHSSPKDVPVWINDNLSVRIMRGYRPNPNLLPDGWVIAVHKASGTRHTFYLRTSGPKVVDEAEMRQRTGYNFGPRPHFQGDRQERAEFRPPVDAEYMSEQLVRVIGELLGERYLVREARLVEYMRSPFSRLDSPFTLPSGAQVIPHYPNDANYTGVPLGQFELMQCGTSDRKDQALLQATLPFPPDADLREFDYEGLVHQIAQQIREHRPAGGGSTLVWKPMAGGLLRSDPHVQMLVIDL